MRWTSIASSFITGKPVSKSSSPPPNATLPPALPVARARVPATSLAARAYLEIRNKILRGDLPIGTALSRRQLAAELNISVPPITEALQQLEIEGLVESAPRVGTRVRVPTRRDVEDRAIVREALETQSARLFVERATPGEKAELSRMGYHLDQLYSSIKVAAGDRDFLFLVNTYHMGLHLHIAECARCGALHAAIEKEQVLVYNWLYDTAVQRRTLSMDYHVELTAVLETGTPDEAAEAMRKHIRRGLGQVLEKMDAMGDPKGGWRPKRSPAP